MSPKLTLYNFVNNGARNSEFEGHALTFTAFVQCSNVLHIIFGKFRPSVLRSLVYSPPHPSLGNTIRHVVSLGPKEQMMRVTTRRIVALVKNAKSVGCAMMKNPTCDVCSYLFAALSIFVGESVSMAQSTKPQPTSTPFGLNEHVSPKTFKEVFGESLRFKKFYGRIVLHKIVCATLSGVRSPRGHFHCGWTPLSCQ